MGVTIRDNNRIPQAIQAVRKLNNTKIRVGYLKDSELQMIAAVHEFGARITVTDKMRGYLASQGMHLKGSTTHIVIPERSFLRTGADLHGNDVVIKADRFIKDVLEGNISPQLFAEMLGLELKGKIQEHAIDLNNPVNHPFTVAQKGSSNPLVDNGGLIGAMEVEVE